MSSQINFHDDGTIELKITIAWDQVEKIYNQVVDDYSKNSQLKGFRKGKAPKKLIEESLDKTKIYEEVLRQLLPQAYSDSVKEHNINPIIVPKVELKEAKEKSDWLIYAYTCQKPVVELDNYKSALKLKKSQMPQKIWTPGEDKSKPDEKEQKSQILDHILKSLFELVKIKLPRLLVEQEVNRLLSDLIDQTKKLGLTVEQYLASTHKTSDSIKEEYTQQAQRALTLEFTLEKVADIENIFVTDDEIEKAISSAKTDQEKETLKKEKYYLASLIRRQKTLDFLASL